MNVFLTRMKLNPTRVTTKRMLTSSQVTHALVMGSIADHGEAGLARTLGRVLWRLDRSGDHTVELYVVSPGRPDLTGVVEQAGWPTQAAWDTADYGPFLARLSAGQRWRFRLTANPVRALKDPNGGRGRVVPHRTADYQLSWLLERSATIGFNIPTTESGNREVVVRDRRVTQFLRRDDRRFGAAGDDDSASPPSQRRVALTTATFEGVLEVTDAEALRLTLVAGVGRAKGYGCGLLTLARYP